MSARVRAGLVGAALLGPLVAFPTLLRPELAIAGCLAVVVAFLASRSVAYPLALWGVPGIAIALLGTNPFPNDSVELFLVGWLVLAIFFTLLREEHALPLRLLLAGPVLITLGLAVLMLARLGSSADPAYGGFKLQLFLAENVTFLVAGILAARHRRHLNLWLGLLLATVSAGALVLVHGLATGGLDEAFPGRFALYAQAGPIPLARGAATGILLAVFVLLVAREAWKRTAALALAPVLAVAFVAAGSRGPVLGLAAGLLVLLALSFRDRLSRRRMAALAAAVLVSALLIPQLVPGQNVSRSLSVLVGGGQDGSGGDLSNGRYQLWSQAWSSFGEHPLAGIGTGGFARVDPVGVYPHNILLEASSELGVLGLALVAGLIGLGFLHAVRAWRRAEGEDRHHAALVTAFLAAAVVNAQLSGDLTSNAAVWLGAGLAFGLLQRVVPSPEREPLGRLRARWRRQGSGPPGPVLPGGFLPAPAPDPSPARGPGPGAGAITAPADGSSVRGEVAVAVSPAGVGWTVGSVVVEHSADGRTWAKVGEALSDGDYELFVVTAGGGRRHVAIVRSRRRAEQMRAMLASEHGVEIEQIEVRPARRRSLGGTEARETGWDTRLVEDGLHRLRAVTTDAGGRRAVGPEVTVAVDNTPPSVRVETPRQGAVLMGVVELAAVARDQGTGVAVVRFELSVDGRDRQAVRECVSPPYRTSWNTASIAEGDCRLRAVAIDNAGNAAVTDEIAIRVRRVAAALALEDPGKSLSGTVRLRARLYDETHTAGLEFQVAPADSFAWRTLGAVTRAPFELDVDTRGLPDGAYDLRALARGKDGGIDASRIVGRRLIDNVPPMVSLYEPRAGAVVRGGVPLRARAADVGSGVSSLLFQVSVDGGAWQVVVAAGRGPSSVSWDTSKVPDGPCRLRAVAADGAGNLTASEPVPVHVDNTPPRVSLEEPRAGARLAGTVRLRMTAEDTGSGLSGARFEWSPTGSVWGELVPVAGPSYDVLWDTTKVADGAYRLRAAARDRAGNVARGEPIEVVIRNGPGAPEPEPPPRESAPPELRRAPEPGANSRESVPPERRHVREPEPPLSGDLEAATLWQLERLVRERGDGHPRREEVEALLLALRPYAQPDGTIPERFRSLLGEPLRELLG